MTSSCCRHHDYAEPTGKPRGPRNIDSLAPFEARAVLAGVMIYRRQVSTWLKELKGLDPSKEGLQVEISPLDPAFTRLLEMSLLLAYLLGHSDAQEMIKAQELQSFGDPEEWDAQPFTEAIERLRKKKVIPTKTYHDIEEGLRHMAFTVASIENETALAAINKSLLEAAKEGMGPEEWNALLPRLFNAYGVMPLSPHHIETVFRTNLGSVYNGAREKEALQSPSVKYFQYLGVSDGRESDICRPYFDRVYRKDDPVWKTISPLNHYQCRCAKIPLTEGYVKANGIKVSNKLSPEELGLVQKGFRGNSVEAGRDVIREQQGRLDKILAGKRKAAKRKLASMPKPAPEVKLKNADNVSFFGATPGVRTALETVAQEWERRVPEIRLWYYGTGHGHMEIRHQVGEWIKPDITSPYGGTMGHYLPGSRNGLAINSGIPEANFLKSLKRDAASGFHPPGCDSLKSVLDHEFGHALHEYLATNGSQFAATFKADYLKRLRDMAREEGGIKYASGYYTRSAKPGQNYSFFGGTASRGMCELFAEMVSELLNNPNPRVLALEVEKLIMQFYPDWKR